MRAQKLSESEIVFKPHLSDKRFIDLTGEVFDRLIVLGFAGRAEGGASNRGMWFCRCECGVVVKVFANVLRAGQCRSCGCLASDLSAKRLLVHGDNRVHKKHYLYIIRNGIVARCCNPRRREYKDYGGRGITLFDEWKNSYIAFRDYILENLGERPENHQLDRIKNDRGYEPGNLRWATPSQNTLNRRNTKYLTIDGVTMPRADWARMPGADNRKLIESRLRAGWSAREAVFGKKHSQPAVPNVAAAE
jgi:hypothetical protein